MKTLTVSCLGHQVNRSQNIDFFNVSIIILFCIDRYVYGYNVYIILSSTSDDYDSGGAEGHQRERERERVTEIGWVRELPDIVPARVLCEICSSAKIIFRPSGGGAG